MTGTGQGQHFVITRDQAIQEATVLYAALYRDLVARFQEAGARGVAVWAAGEDAPEDELQRIAAQAEAWAGKASAKQDAKGRTRREGGANTELAKVRLKPSQVKHTAPRGTGFSAAVKLAVRTRAGLRCEACGIWLGWHEGKVGSRRAGDFPFCDTVHNACLFCDKCRLAAEQRDPVMNAAGFWLSSNEDPREVPLVFHHMDGCVAWLTQNGDYSVTPPEGKTA
jgi:hypothetical protein